MSRNGTPVPVQPAPGRGPELQYDVYFPPNRCLPVDKPAEAAQCPQYVFPLKNVPAFESIYASSCVQATPANTSIYGQVPQPSELYGDALGMNEANGSFYYKNPYGFDLTKLTYAQNQPYHYRA